MIGAGGGECKDGDEVADGDRAMVLIGFPMGGDRTAGGACTVFGDGAAGSPRADELLCPDRDRGEAARGEMARGVVAALEPFSCFHGCFRRSSEIS